MELLLEEDLVLIDGGKNWFKIVGGTIITVAGVAGVITYPTLGGKVGSFGVTLGGINTIVEGWSAD